ncbi:MAG: DMT family transporter [Acidobacteriota bacterium]|nr:DMT family transporter [Acidobacteriota bacterium]
MTSRSSAALQAVVAGILFSTGGAAVKATELDGWQVAGTRSLIAAVVLLVAIPAARRWAGGPDGTSRVAAIGWWRSPARRSALLLTVGTGCCYCLTLVLFVHAAKRTTAAETIFLQSTAPLFVLLLSPILLRERLGWRRLLFVPLFGAGLVMAFFGGAEAVASAPDPRTGNVLAVFCGLAYGLTLMGLRAAGRSPAARPVRAAGAASSLGDGEDVRATGIAAAACGNVIVCLACLPVMATLTAAAPGDFLVVAYLGLFQVALAYVFVARAASVLQAPVVALLLLLEPALTPVWAMWFHGEQPHLLTWLGGAVIAVATVLLAAVVRSPKE